MDSLRLLVTEPSADNRHAPFTLGDLLPPDGPLNTLSTPLACSLLRDVAFALGDLLAAKRGRSIVAVSNEHRGATGAPLGAPWQLALERRADDVLISVFRQGHRPEVALWERRLPLSVTKNMLLAAIDRLDARLPQPLPTLWRMHRRGITMARVQLAGAHYQPAPPPPEATALRAHSATAAPWRLSFGAHFVARQESATADVYRSDLHALLFRGSLSLTRAENTRSFHQLHLFLLLDQLLAQLTRALTSAQLRHPFGERSVISGLTSSMQLRADGLLTWELGPAGAAANWRLFGVPVQQFTASITSLCEQLYQQLLAADPAQRSNLRLDAFRQRLTALGAMVEKGENLSVSRSLVNGSPESYRAFAEAETPLPAAIVVQPSAAMERLRFTESWRADVPGIDLKSFFLVGNAVLIGSTREVACIERQCGEVIWRQAMPRAASVLTAVGLARLAPTGEMTLHDLRDGQAIDTLKLAPTVGGSTRGSVIRAPGLPNMLLVADGAEHLTAIDLDAFEVRWRRRVERLGPVHLRRAGKLLIVTAGGDHMLALDLLTGEVVWRHASAHRYRRAVTVHQNSIFAMTYAPGHGRGATLSHIDPWTGEQRWRKKLDPQWSASGPVLACSSSVAVVTRQQQRHGVVAFERDSGSTRFVQPHRLCRGECAVQAFDDHIISNSASGELVALDAVTGETRYRHIFASRNNCADDRPDNLKPVLRAGALFVPQTEVYVVRPHDGRLVGTLPSDLIADALRVDEHCGVYMAEQSGYVAAYHPGARLRLLR